MGDVVGQMQDAEHGPAQTSHPAGGRGRGDDPGDADRGQRQVHAADVSDKVLVLRAVDADPVQSEAGKRGVEGVREELRPYPNVEAEECSHAEDRAAVGVVHTDHDDVAARNVRLHAAVRITDIVGGKGQA